jgi:hypothetical protein
MICWLVYLCHCEMFFVLALDFLWFDFVNINCLGGIFVVSVTLYFKKMSPLRHFNISLSETRINLVLHNNTWQREFILTPGHILVQTLQVMS